MTKSHPELVARLATSNISTEDFVYLTTYLMESQTCENCKYLSSCGKQCNNEEVGKMVDEDHIIVHSMVVYKDFGCNKFERKKL